MRRRRNVTTGPNSVAIVAMGLSHRDYVLAAAVNGGRLAVADEIWAINAMAGIIQFDRAFIMDDLRPQARDHWVAERTEEAYDAYHRWLPKQTAPVYTSHPISAYPCMVDYPLEDVLNTISLPYLNTTVAYAVAYAIHLGVKSIKLYGCDFTYQDRHASESGRACVEFLLARAIHYGVEVEIANSSTLMDTNSAKRFYGYSDQILLDFDEKTGRIIVRREETTTCPESKESATQPTPPTPMPSALRPRRRARRPSPQPESSLAAE